VLGLEEASGYLSLVGDSMGSRLLEEYRAERGSEAWDLTEVSEVLVDLKRRIDGGFVVESMTDDEIVFHNSKCPFGDVVTGHPSMCMMTSNVFGRITAEQFGQARIELEETIADGDGRCVVRVSLDLDKPPRREDARDYFADRS
jgi:predicted ArsR family transcriptional regulator